MQIQVQTPAKINLILEILKKREDGFHEIQSIMQAVSLYDYLIIEIENIFISLTGKELGDFENINDLRKAAINYYKTNIQGQTINHPDLGEIQFTARGIEKTRHASADIRKLKIIPKLTELIKNAKLEGTLENYKLRKDGFIKFHYLMNKASINGNIFDHRIIICEDENGNKYYDLNDKNYNPPKLPDLQKSDLGGSDIIITDENKNLNPSQNIIELSGNSEQIPYDKTNLVYKAAELFLQKANLTGFKIKISIEKNIPVAAGLAGGSSNAAGTLWGLNQIFENILSSSELHELASQMGSDLNFCLEGGTQVATSRGEFLSKIPTPGLNIVIIKPKNLFISAREAYTKYAALPQKPEIKGLEEMKSAICENNSDKISELINNHLEEAILPDYPEIQAIKNYLIQKGCKNALMSGSGPSVFGIYESKMDLSDAKPEWECFKTKTINFGVTRKLL